MSTVIIGSGHGGVQVAQSLRMAGYEEAVTIVTEESTAPYQRPPLSKEYMRLGAGAAPLPLISEEDIEAHAINVLNNTRVDSINREAKTITANGEEISYDHLVIATGARPRRIPTDGADATGVYRLKTLEDAMSINDELGKAKRIAVVGAGFIGMEFAVGALQHDCEVTVLEFAPRPMGRALTGTMSEWFMGLYDKLGIDLHVNEGLAQVEVDENNKATGVTSTTGAFYPADMVLTGIGVIPNQELAEEAGLEVANGIIVNENLQTSDPSIFAIGDCASFPTSWAIDRVRLESVQNATDQGKHVARSIMEGPSNYAALPWFWSTQGKYRLQMTGLIRTDDETRIIGDPDAAKFTVLVFRDGYLVGAESVNSPGDQNVVRRLLNDHILLPIDAVDEEDFDLRGFLRASLATANA